MPASCAPRPDLAPAQTQPLTARRARGAQSEQRGSLPPRVTPNPPAAPPEALPAGDASPRTRQACPRPPPAAAEPAWRPGRRGSCPVPALGCAAPLARLRPGHRPALALRASSLGAAPPPALCRSLPHADNRRRRPGSAGKPAPRSAPELSPLRPRPTPPSLPCAPGSRSPAARVSRSPPRAKGLQLPACSAPGRGRAGPEWAARRARSFAIPSPGRRGRRGWEWGRRGEAGAGAWGAVLRRKAETERAEQAPPARRICCPPGPSAARRSSAGRRSAGGARGSAGSAR